jgi:hypothetical protein
MIAVLHVKLPFELLIPEGAEYILRTYQDDDYSVQVGVPARSDSPNREDAPDSVLINDKKSFQADVLTITFGRESFNRELSAEVDPPYCVMNRAIASFLDRLKYASRAPQIQMIELPEGAWRLTYLNDDGSELEKQEGLKRGHGVAAFGFSWIACDPALWEIVHSLPPNFSPPEWRTLLTDAAGALPHVGTAIVLTATSLEVFIAELLNQLQARSSLLDSAWSWVNDRSNRQNNPTVEEQYSLLLSIFCGKSLKDETVLWQRFKNLKTARNSFVHTGAAIVGGNRVTTAQAREYIALAESIIATIRDWIPDEMRWPVFDHQVELQIVKALLRPQVQQEGPESAP